MLTKKHIKQHLTKLSSGTASHNGEMSGAVWREFHEYLIRHYRRFDKDAKGYADDIFDQLETGLEKNIALRPEGPGKRALRRSLSIVRGERCPVSVLYLDTPVIENIITFRLGLPLDKHVAKKVEALYERILSLVKSRKWICPEDNFHREALQTAGPPGFQGLSVVETLSEGLSFKHSQSIEDSQVFRALRSFISGDGPTNYRKYWHDGFRSETVRSITARRRSIVFKGIPAIAEKEGPPAAHEDVEAFSIRLVIRCDEISLKEDHELEKRSTRHLRDLVRLGVRYRTVATRTSKGRLDGFWAGQKTDLPVALWNHYGGKPEGVEGLASFYESEHFEDVPAIKVKRDIWNLLFDGQDAGLGPMGGPANLGILAAVLPYADMMILDPRMAHVAREMLGLGAKFDTDIYGMNEHDRIMTALKQEDDPG